jgi:hypothetical protein
VTADQLHALAVRRFVLAAIVLPLVLVAVGVTVQVIALPHLPATIAVHWNAAGEPDRFAPAWTQPLVTIALGAGIPLLIGLTSLPGLRRGDRGVTYRFLGAVSAGSATLVTAALTWTLVAQAGEPAAAPPVWKSLFGAIVAAAIVGLIAWFIQPKEEWSRPSATAATPLAIAAGERIVWLRTASIHPRVAIGISLVVLVLAVTAFGAWLTGAADGVVWLLILVTIILVALAATSLAFHVRVDEAGLTVRSVLGIPRFRVPLGEIVTASKVDVNPMGEFGGWGLRLSVDRRFGVVLRAGEAIEVTRTSGRRFVITVDDAGTGAGLLQALVERDAATRP